MLQVISFGACKGLLEASSCHLDPLCFLLLGHLAKIFFSLNPAVCEVKYTSCTQTKHGTRSLALVVLRRIAVSCLHCPLSCFSGFVWSPEDERQ